ncbi:MAG TPA: trypsin-like peptidase domain-containing protein [Pirellulales bacterium]
MRAISRRGFVIALILMPAVARAEFRTWSAAVGAFRVEAEFIDLHDGVVRLRLKDGSQRAVPLERLSAADQQYAQQRTGKAAAENPRLAKIERETAKCPSAEERLRLYKVFCQDPETTDSDRRAVAGQMLKLRELAEKRMVWLRGGWATQEQFEQVRNQANSLMRQGIELLRLKQEDGFRRKFADAAALEPDLIRADFLAGMYFALSAADFSKSKQCFEKCLKREPDNVAVLNNLALVELKRGAAQQALAIWQKAVEIEPNQHLVQNLGRLLRQAGEKKITASKHSTDVASELYTGLLSSEKFKPASSRRGWIFMLLDEDLLSLAKTDPNQKKEGPPAHLPPPTSDGAVVIGGGTGFVVARHYILTNNHVVASGTSFEVQAGEGGPSARFSAKVVAHCEKPDLALLYCEGIAATPLPLDPAPCRRGTDIMTLGYPEMFLLGASLKATRGVISAVPSSVVDDMYLYDAVVNHGNSGGPVCNRQGNVVAVTTIMVSTEGKYGGGIPAAAALAFVRKHVPDYHEPDLQSTMLEWPSVDEKASPSTLLIWSRSQTPAASRPVVGSGYFEDRSCSQCAGQRTVDCKCAAPSGARRRSRSAQADPCPICQGKKVVPCNVCRGLGIDPEFLPQRMVPSPSAPGAPPPAARAAPSSDGSADSKLAARIEAAIRSGRMEASKLLGAQGGGKPFSYLPPDRGILVGFDLRYNQAGHLVSVRSLYQTDHGLNNTQWQGSPAATTDQPVRIAARPGYAVGGLRTSRGESLDELTVVFMRIAGGRLDRADRYETQPKAAPPSGPAAEVGMQGALAIGILGQTGPTPDTPLISLGLTTIGSDERPRRDQPGNSLDPALADTIQQAMRAGRLKNTDLLGKRSGGEDFTSHSSDRGVLIGLDLWFDRDGHVLAVRSLFQTARGQARTRPCGTTAEARSNQFMARPGYAIGGLRIPQGESLDEMTIVFMRLDGDHLDPTARYETSVKPTPPTGPSIEVGMTGSLIVGTIGKTTPPPSGTLTSLGLVAYEAGSARSDARRDRQ